MQKIALHDHNLAIMGYVEMAGRLPSHIYIGAQLFERYGQISNYRYVLIPSGYVYDVPKENVTWL